MSKKRIRIADFVEAELRHFRAECNFTDSELKFFNLRSKNKSIVEICFAMNISERTAYNISKAVNKKILKVIK